MSSTPTTTEAPETAETGQCFLKHICSPSPHIYALYMLFLPPSIRRRYSFSLFPYYLLQWYSVPRFLLIFYSHRKNLILKHTGEVAWEMFYLLSQKSGYAEMITFEFIEITKQSSSLQAICTLPISCTKFTRTPEVINTVRGYHATSLSIV